MKTEMIYLVKLVAKVAIGLFVAYVILKAGTDLNEMLER
jgi:hypothetical protein